MQSVRCREKYTQRGYCYRAEIEEEIVKSIPKHVLTKCPVGKVVRIAAALLRLNLLECSVLSWLLRKSRFDFEKLFNFASSLTLLDDQISRQLILFLLLNAYYVKSFLSQDGLCPKLDSDLLSIIPSFSEIYRSWRPDCSLQALSLNQITSTFEAWTVPNQKIQKPDYNELVNKILQLSKTYNVGNVEEEVPQKRRKLENGEGKRIQRRQQASNDGEQIQEQIWQDDHARDMNPLRRSARNSSHHYFNFNNQLVESRNQLFRSRSIQNSGVWGGNLIGSLRNSGFQLKPTSSYDQFK